MANDRPHADAVLEHAFLMNRLIAELASHSGFAHLAEAKESETINKLPERVVYEIARVSSAGTLLAAALVTLGSGTSSLALARLLLEAAAKPADRLSATFEATIALSQCVPAEKAISAKYKARLAEAKSGQDVVDLQRDMVAEMVALKARSGRA